MDNDDNFTEEYNVGHTMGFGTSDGKYKAPDDTYPAYTPKYYLGGFSCIDCHSPHGNKQRILGYNNLYSLMTTAEATATYWNWAVPGAATTETFAWGPSFAVGNPGRTQPYWGGDPDYVGEDKAGKPLWKAGKWILVKNPDQEIAWTTITPSTTLPPVYYRGQMVVYGPYNSIPKGAEIPDVFTEKVATGTGSYPVNKLIVDWERPAGNNQAGAGQFAYHRTFGIFFVSEMCADCHDGNAGVHTAATLMFSEDRAARGDANPYDIGYSHDNQPRHCGRQQKFNPENSVSTTIPGSTADGNFGPHCRNCHSGSNDCSNCHSPYGNNVLLGRGVGAWTSSIEGAANYDRPYASDPLDEQGLVGASTYYSPIGYRNSRSFAQTWPVDWDTTAASVGAICSNDGFSWPHRTMGFKLLKDELWGLDRDGSIVGVGGTKTVYNQVDPYPGMTSATAYTTQSIAAHDLDSVCLECHDPNVWRASSYSSYNQANGIYDDQLLLRGLP
jgi:hypothetical protein